MQSQQMQYLCAKFATSRHAQKSVTMSYEFNSNEVKALREQRAAAHAKAITVLAKGNTLTADDKLIYSRAMSEVDSLGAKIQTLEAAARGQQPRDYSREASIWSTPENHLRHAAFMRFVRSGADRLEAQDRMLIEKRDIAEGAPMLTHVGTYTGLGYFVPTGFAGRIEQATKWFAPLTDGSVLQLMNTDTVQPIPFPVADETSNIATIVNEAGTVEEEDVTAGQVVLGGYKLSSGIIKASVELLADSAFDIEGYLSQRFGERFGRGLENYLTNGTGSSQPTGLLTAIIANGAEPVVAVGSSANDGSAATGANSIGYDDLVALEHSVDPSYRRNAQYMFHDQTLAALQRLLDKYGRPLWSAGIAVNAPDTINGYKYTINQSMPQIGSVSEANTVIFGDFSKFIVRKVQDMRMQRLNELYATTGQVGFLADYRIDSNLIASSTSHPLNILQQHS
jgi:HK97 family phage major capsid protein